MRINIDVIEEAKIPIDKQKPLYRLGSINGTYTLLSIKEIEEVKNLIQNNSSGNQISSTAIYLKKRYPTIGLKYIGELLKEIKADMKLFSEDEDTFIYG